MQGAVLTRPHEGTRVRTPLRKCRHPRGCVPDGGVLGPTSDCDPDRRHAITAAGRHGERAARLPDKDLHMLKKDSVFTVLTALAVTAAVASPAFAKGGTGGGGG